MKSLLLSFLVLATAGAWAQEADVAGERARISGERKQVEERFASEEKACRAKFAVTDCLNDAKARRRDAVGELRRQELTLNEADRKRKAAERLREIDQKQSAAQQQRQADKRAESVKDQQQREARAAEKAAKRTTQGQGQGQGAEPAKPAQPDKAQAAAQRAAEAQKA
ncbi:hypothetical protein, partial [Ramlibacter sp.]|uniref:hypothetical protein n=1 Tax=Ramlibacter sp. TaxID=1917967 RepID=UPI00180A23CB